MQVERLLLQRAVERRLGGERVSDFDAALECALVRYHLADHPPLQRRLRVDLLTGPQQPLRASRAGNLLPDDVQAVPAGDAEGRMGLITVGRPLRSDVDVREKQVFRMNGCRPV